MENTKLITNILAENYVDAEKQITETLGQHINEKMDSIKQIIAQQYFGQISEEESKEDQEKQMDDEAGKKSGIEDSDDSKKNKDIADKSMKA